MRWLSTRSGALSRTAALPVENPATMPSADMEHRGGEAISFDCIGGARWTGCFESCTAEVDTHREFTDYDRARIDVHLW